jgi:XTP/dITP diphosphohydrolase
MNLTFVSTNGGKFREARSILSSYGVSLRWSRRELPEVQAGRLEPVVRAKLDAAAASRPRVLVEDSGLFIDALDGFPGVYSSYALETIGLVGILRLLRGRGRQATFRSVAGLSIDGHRRTFAGQCQGQIARRAKGDHGFGFDPLFIPTGERRTFAELAPVEKNRRSHRAMSLHRVGRFLRHWM